MNQPSIEFDDDDKSPTSIALVVRDGEEPNRLTRVEIKCADAVLKAPELAILNATLMPEGFTITFCEDENGFPRGYRVTGIGTVAKYRALLGVLSEHITLELPSFGKQIPRELKITKNLGRKNSGNLSGFTLPDN